MYKCCFKQQPERYQPHAEYCVYMYKCCFKQPIMCKPISLRHITNINLM